MPYLNVDLDFFEHPKTKRLVGLLGRGAEVIPIKLWAYCGKFHADTGRLAGYSEQEIEAMVDWWGKSGAMLQALLRVGFMAKEGADWFIVDWSEHQGHIAAFKARGRLMAQARWKKADAASNAVSIPARNAPTDPTDPTNWKRANGDRPVEFPKGFPATEADALTVLDAIGVPEGFARMVYNEVAARNGMDCFGQPVSRWSYYLKARFSKEQGRIAERRQQQPRNGSVRVTQSTPEILPVPTELT